MLKESGSKILGTSVITDEILNYYGWGDSKKELKLVAVKGYIDDWSLYVEAMDKDMDINEVRSYGNKINCRERIKFIVDCDDEVLGRYRD